MPTNKIDAYGTHINVLKDIAKQLKLAYVLEFGAGIYSTDFFLGIGAKVVSIEQQSDAWFEKVKAKHEKNKSFNIMFMYGPGKGPAWLEESRDKFDLIFVDGDSASRWLCVNAAFDKTDIIVAHDTEEKMYSWEKINVPKGWTKVDFKDVKPWTTVWFNKDIKLSFKETKKT